MFRMSALRKYLRYPALAMACLLAACQTVSPLVAARSSDRAIELNVKVVRDRKIQAIVKRHLVADIARYRARLMVWDADDGQFVDLPTPIYKNLGPDGDGTITFNHLGPYRYQVSVVGENADGEAITTAQTAEYDLTDPAGNFSAPIARTVQMAMQPVIYAGTMALPTWGAGGVLPAGAESVEIEIRDPDGGVVAHHAYGPGQAFRATNLQAGVTYTLSGTATFSGGGTLTDEATFTADADAASLDSDIPLPAGFSLYPGDYQVTGGANRIVADSEGGVWVNDSAGTIDHLTVSANGVPTRASQVAPYSVSSEGSGGSVSAMAADDAGGVWVVKAPRLMHVTPTQTTYVATTVGADFGQIVPDGSGGVWVSSLQSFTPKMVHVTESAGTATLTTVGISANVPGAAVADDAGGVWVTSGDVVRHATPALASGATAPAITLPLGGVTLGALVADGDGGAFVTGNDGAQVAHVLPNHTATDMPNFTGPATRLAADHGGGFWWASGTKLGHTPGSGAELTFDLTETPLAIQGATDGTTVWALMAGGSLRKYTRSGAAISLSATKAVASNAVTFTLDANQRPSVVAPGRVDVILE